MSHAPSRTSLVVATPAALAAYTASFDSGDEADVTSLGFTFIYDASSVAAIDNVTVINGPGGAGRWLRGVAAVSQNDRNRHAQFVDTTDTATGLATDASILPSSKLGVLIAGLVLSAFTAIVAIFSNVWVVLGTGVAAVDTPAVQAAVTAAAGRTVYLIGTFAINSRILLGASYDVRGIKASVVSSLPLNGANFWFLFYAVAGADVTVTATTLAAPAADGSTSISTVGTVAAGKWIRVNALDGSLAAQTFQVVSVSGLGPYTLALDRPVRFAFAASDTVDGVIPPYRSRIGGLQISGTGARAIQIAGSVECEIYDVQIDGVWEWGLASFDLAGRDNTYRNISGSNTLTTGGLGIAMEGQVGGGISQCDLAHLQSYGVFISLCRSVNVTNVHVIDANTSFRVDAQTAGNGGSVDVDLSGCSSRSARNAAYVVTDASSRIRLRGCVSSTSGSDAFSISGSATDVAISDCVAISATGNGFNIFSSATPCDVGLSNATARSCTSYGVRVSGASVRVQIANIVADLCSQYGMIVDAAYVTGSGYRSQDCTLGAMQSTNAGAMSVDGIDLVRTTTQAGWIGVSLGSTSRSTIRGGRITMTGASSYMVGVSHSGAAVDCVSGLTITGSGGATFYGINVQTAGSVQSDAVVLSGAADNVTAPATIVRTTYA